MGTQEAHIPAHAVSRRLWRQQGPGASAGDGVSRLSSQTIWQRWLPDTKPPFFSVREPGISWQTAFLVSLWPGEIPQPHSGQHGTRKLLWGAVPPVPLLLVGIGA